ncbi:CPBP family intramembrane glutamic endopeptidase [Leptolyngbya sp. AN02str]|uniref:CPBP family intramembrane glutamic endopeptidase n=1 Tax=Leptolyngbya sp. AN02str TaxID=3423363 RepID=UPI003D31E301
MTTGNLKNRDRALARWPAALWLALVCVAASGGTTLRFFGPRELEAEFGAIAYTLSRLLLLGLPLVWWWRNSREFASLQFTPPTRAHWRAGLGWGLAMAGIILATYVGLGRTWISPEAVRQQAQAVGITSPAMFLMGAAYFSLLNAVVEEYVWRWFVYDQWERLLGHASGLAMLGAALWFTLHHILALAAYTPIGVVVLGSVGVFVAGMIWCECYRRYRSIWPSYISHVLADLAIALVGWQLLFG